MDLDSELRSELAGLEGAGRLRHTRAFGGVERANVQSAEHGLLLSFCSNDYLGLGSHPDLAAASAVATREAGFGAGSSRLVAGETPWHRELERSLAAFLHRPDALVFPTGYQTNMGVIASLAGPDDCIASDASNHASIIDGCRLSRAHVQIYPHGDAEAARAALIASSGARRRLLITESVFSMDGDRAPLRHLAAAAKETRSVLVVDEAHALGVTGPGGRGVCAELDLEPDVLIGTLGKALGACGGFAAGSIPLRDILINRARSFIFATAGPPGVMAAAAALALVRSPAGDTLRAHATARSDEVRAGLRELGFPTAGTDLIIPLVIGSDRDALEAAASLLRQKLLVPAIRPPTVPPGTARLRITVSASHTAGDVEKLLRGLAHVRDGLRATVAAGRPR